MSNNPATIEQAYDLLGRIKAKKPNRDQIELLFSSGLLSDFLDADLTKVDRETVRKALGLDPIMADIFRLVVSPGLTLQQRIQAGSYGWFNDDITEARFPVGDDQLGEFEGRLFHFNRDISSENAVKEIENAAPDNPWQPAQIGHLLSFGETFPEQQRKYPIVALGSSAKIGGDRLGPYLLKWSAGRELDLYWWSDDWSGLYRFLAVRKLSSGS